jgi:hypothetical protein
MGEHTHKLEIFRGYIKFKNNTQKIIGVLILLSVVTLIEVVLGIYKPAILNEYFLNLKLLNWIFIILTIVKAYYITWDFMHMDCSLFDSLSYFYINSRGGLYI